MPSARLVIIGAGGHGKVVVDATQSTSSPIEIVLTDEAPSKWNYVIAGKAVVSIDEALLDAQVFHVAIGENTVRERVVRRLLSRGMRYEKIAHSRACIAGTATVGDGVFLAAQSVVGPDSVVGLGTIINHGAIVDHDCQIGQFVHIAPGATLGGGVSVGMGAMIGAGANILPGISVGQGCTVGAGAVVLGDLEPHAVYVGVPARKLNTVR
jgi:sugar O-acyltransferase (sialic acid O-acetyltransferase NeuD family)